MKIRCCARCKKPLPEDADLCPSCVVTFWDNLQREIASWPRLEEAPETEDPPTPF